MDIVFINPKSFSNAYVAEPLGLMYLDSAVSVAGYTCKCFDLNFNEDFEEYRYILENKLTNIYAITCYTDNRYQVISVVNEIRKKHQFAKILLGGHHPTFLPDEILQNYDVDVIIRGEGEETLIEFMKYVKGDESLNIEDIKGISYKFNNEIIHNADRELIRDISCLPWPKRLTSFSTRYEFYKQYLNLYKFNIDLNTIKAAGIITSRGCSYNCVYCSIQKFWKRRVRYRHISEVIREIKYLVDSYNINFLYIWDDIFTLDKERVLSFCRQLKINNIYIKWACITRVDLIDNELLAVMKNAGCTLISYGVESGNSYILSKISKHISKEQIIKTIEATKKQGVDTRISLLVGSPGENDQTIKETEELLKILRPNGWSVNILRLYPKTDLCDNLISEGKFNNRYWQEKETTPYYTEELDVNKLLKYKFRLEEVLRDA